MIRDRYDPVNLFRLVPQLQLEMEPTLAQLDHLLDDDVLFAAVKADLSRRYPRSTRCGRQLTPVEVILRMLVLKHLYHWSYEATEQFVNDSLVLRQFCRLGLHKAPDDTTLLRWANLIQPRPCTRSMTASSPCPDPPRHPRPQAARRRHRRRNATSTIPRQQLAARRRARAQPHAAPRHAVLQGAAPWGARCSAIAPAGRPAAATHSADHPPRGDAPRRRASGLYAVAHGSRRWSRTRSGPGRAHAAG